MIRINLLGRPKAKSKRAATAAMDFESSGSPNSINALLAIAVLVVTAGGIWYYQNQLNTQAAKIQHDMAIAKVQAAQLAQTKARFMERQKVKDEYEARVKVIDALRASQTGPVDLLTMVSATVNNTDEVWLSGLNDAGNAVDVDGVALSANAVANLMTNLMKTGYFKSVEIKQTYQDEAQTQIQAFNFTLICDKQVAKKS
ncbi:MAG TPA: PilN domain-containing protein [Terriglobales bacterium]|nr:PilN domain-containing protein [Terriglobales bacterium]